MEEKSIKLLQQVKTVSEAKHIETVTPDTLAWFEYICRWGNYQNILEVGTGLGYSTLAWAMILQGQGRIISLERDETRHCLAQSHLRQSGYQNVELRWEDARETLQDQKGPFDLIFLDAAMAQYEKFFYRIIEELTPGGMLIADNIFIEDLLFKDEKEIPRRRRNMQKKIKSFLRVLNQQNFLATQMLPLGDGLILAWKFK